MSVDLYERYKDALRRGHTALARGQLEPALDAYREALALAPDRALPQIGVGQVLLRQGLPADALTAFDLALTRTPRDESGLRGRADALTRLGRRTEAADALDILSDAQEAAGRLGDACDTTRRALDLAEQKARRRRLLDLTRRLRVQAGDQASEVALANALRVLGGTEGPPGPIDVPAAATRQPDVLDQGPPPDVAAEVVPPPEPEPMEVAPLEKPAPEPVPAEPPPDPVAIVARAESALDTGDLASALQAYLAAAAVFEASGLVAAALDACYVALSFAPDDADVHLRLVELYLELGWNAPAADKLALLGRLAELDNRQGHARAQIVGLAADHFPDDPRLRRLSAQGSARP